MSGAARAAAGAMRPAAGAMRAVVGATRAAALALCVVPALVNAAPYALDPTHSFVYFELPASGLSTQHARFDHTRGEVEYDRLGKSAKVEVSVATASVSTGVATFDRRLCGPELLACDAHPQAVFRAENFAFDASGRPTDVQGTLTLRGQTLPLTLRALRFACYPNPLLLREVCGGDFEAAIDPAAYGMKADAAGALPARIRLAIQVEAIRQ